jgi:excisionase family DNA binding protein
MLTAKQAAEETGRSKEGILKAIKSGRLSASKDGNGQWRIDPAELFRVYPDTASGASNYAAAHLQEHAQYKAENELLRQQIARMESTVEDLRKDRDHWRQQATALLTDQRPRAGGFWSRLFGR